MMMLMEKEKATMKHLFYADPRVTCVVPAGPRFRTHSGARAYEEWRGSVEQGTWCGPTYYS